MERSEKRTRPIGLRLAIIFVTLSAGVSLVVSIVNLGVPFAIPGHLMYQPDFTTLHGLRTYALNLFFILIFNVPLLYGGIATLFDFGNVTVSIVLAFVSALYGIAAWGLYRFKNWARLLMLAISVFAFLPIFGDFPPFFVDSFAGMTAILPFIVAYGLLIFFLKHEDVKQLFV